MVRQHFENCIHTGNLKDIHNIRYFANRRRVLYLARKMVEKRTGSALFFSSLMNICVRYICFTNTIKQ